MMQCFLFLFKNFCFNLILTFLKIRSIEMYYYYGIYSKKEKKSQSIQKREVCICGALSSSPEFYQEWVSCTFQGMGGIQCRILRVSSGARWLECVCVCVQLLSHVQLFVTAWTIAYQAPLSMGFSQARILEWVAIFSSRASSWPRNQICFSCISCIDRRILNHWAPWEAQEYWSG